MVNILDKLGICRVVTFEQLYWFTDDMSDLHTIISQDVWSVSTCCDMHIVRVSL